MIFRDFSGHGEARHHVVHSCVDTGRRITLSRIRVFFELVRKAAKQMGKLFTHIEKVKQVYGSTKHCKPDCLTRQPKPNKSRVPFHHGI